MVYRTTIILNNDFLELLTDDPGIGRKIKNAVSEYRFFNNEDFGNLGNVVEQDHADVAKLVIIGENGQFDITELASIAMHPGAPNDDSAKLILLAKAADKLGMKLIKKPKRKQS